MISGLNSSSISMALRTANNSRATMDKMATQIATGKKVASVKDDGANYVRAAALQTEKAGWQSAKDWLEIRTMTADARQSIKESESATYQELMSSLIGMKGATSTQSFDAYKQQAIAFFAEMDSGHTDNHLGVNEPIYDTTTASLNATVVLPNSTETFFDYPISLHHHTGSWSNVGAIYTFNGYGGKIIFNAVTHVIDIPDTTALDDAITYLRGAFASWTNTVSTHAAGRKKFANLSEISSKAMDRIDGAISSLTDADMGKVSTQRANAEVRQQLALETVRNAISAYSAYANSLLSNVIGIQRNILA